MQAQRRGRGRRITKGTHTAAHDFARQVEDGFVRIEFQLFPIGRFAFDVYIIQELLNIAVVAHDPSLGVT